MHRVLFCLVCKHTNNEVFDEFPEDFRSFPKTSEDDPKMFRSNIVSNIIDVNNITIKLS